MDIQKITSTLSLEEKHFTVSRLEIPIIRSDYYATLGRRLFEIYQKNNIDPKTQRELESLGFLLTAFTLKPAQPSGGFFRFLRRVWKRDHR